MGNDKIRERTYKEMREECLSNARIDANTERQTGRKRKGARDSATLPFEYALGVKFRESLKLEG